MIYSILPFSSAIYSEEYIFSLPPVLCWMNNMASYWQPTWEDLSRRIMIPLHSTLPLFTLPSIARWASHYSRFRGWQVCSNSLDTVTDTQASTAHMTWQFRPATDMQEFKVATHTAVHLDRWPLSSVTWNFRQQHTSLLAFTHPDRHPCSPVTWQQHMSPPMHSYDTRPPTWQPSYLTMHMSPPTHTIPDYRPVTWQQRMSPPTRMIPDCRPGSPVTWQQHMSPHTRMIRLPTRPSSYLTATHVTAHSYDSRLPTWQPSYLTATHVTAHSYDTRLPTWQSSYLTATHVTTHSYDTRLPTWQPTATHVTAHSYEKTADPAVQLLDSNTCHHPLVWY